MEFTPKLPERLLNNNLGISPETLIAMKQKEDAALAMCGGLLGNCYLMAEVVENLMVNSVSNYKKAKWFRQEIKYCLNKSKEELHKTIQSSIRNSPTNADYMREMADAIYDLIKLDLFKLKNAIMIELGKLNVKNTQDVSDLITIDTLLQYINLDYTDTIKYMESIHKCYYDSWYYPAKCESPWVWWSKGIKEYSKKYIQGNVDLNGIPSIQNGIAIIQRKMRSSEIADLAREKVSEVMPGDGSGREVYDKALETLGLIQMG